MDEFVNELVANADHIYRVRFAILSSNFDRALNTMYQPWTIFNGAGLFGKKYIANVPTDQCTFLSTHNV